MVLWATRIDYWCCRRYTGVRHTLCPSLVPSLVCPCRHASLLAASHRHLTARRSLQTIGSDAARCRSEFLYQAWSGSFGKVSSVFWKHHVSASISAFQVILKTREHHGFHEHLQTVYQYVATFGAPCWDLGTLRCERLGSYPWLGTGDRHLKRVCSWRIWLALGRIQGTSPSLCSRHRTGVANWTYRAGSKWLAHPWSTLGSRRPLSKGMTSKSTRHSCSKAWSHCRDWHTVPDQTSWSRASSAKGIKQTER